MLYLQSLRIIRRTGAQLKLGKKDEHGLEEVPSFSSPEKGAPQVNGVLPDETTNVGTYTADDSMDIDQSMPLLQDSYQANTPQARRHNPRMSLGALEMPTDLLYLDQYHPSRVG